MQKIYLKPTAQEIVIKGGPKEGHTDVFTYDYYDDESRRKLGGLYIVGNVKQDDAAADSENGPDIAYVTNLVASLAKREYYSRPDISPKEAFSATLKKIKDVVEEFFKNKSLGVNIGIFAIAGEQILISKLGKFKIILGRESRTVDILNNVDLFSKDTIEEKEFSNIVSGKIMAGDKLFAFYPNRMVIAREKTIKADLLKYDAGQFAENINSVKATKPDFSCGALYLFIDNCKELAVKKPKSTSPTNHSEETGIPVTLANLQEKLVRLPKEAHMDLDQNSQIPVTDAKDVKLEIQEPTQEVPRIISSEFSLGIKVNPILASILAPIKLAKGVFNSWRGTRALKGKFMLLSFVVGILVIGVVLTKMLVVIDPEKRRLNAVIDQTQNNLKLAQTKIDQNDLAGARQLLVDSLSGIYAVGLTNDRTKKTTEEVYGILDNIDKAVDVSPSLLESMPEELNQRIAVLNAHKDLGIAMDVYENNLYILTGDNILKLSDVDKTDSKQPSPWLKSNTLPPQPATIAVDGNIYIINNSGVLAVYYKGEKVSETNTFIVSKSGDVLLTSKNSDKLYLVNKTLARIYELDKTSGSLVKTLKVGSSEPFVDVYLYGDNTVVAVTPDGRIWEIK